MLFYVPEFCVYEFSRMWTLDPLHTIPFHWLFALCITGPGEAGKSTLIKQMQLIHGEDLDYAERLQKIPYIRQNIFDSMVVSYNAIHYAMK